jgi:2-phosphoglycolate phosphatase
VAVKGVRFATVAAVLFDLDGTLADTAPDLAGAANEMRAARNLAALPLAALRPYASHGARGLLGAALARTPADTDYEALRDEFLQRYEARLCAQSQLFANVEDLLVALAARSLPWGIVTNKIARFTIPLVQLLGLASRARVVVSGDTTAHTKPHPEPLLHAARALGLAPAECLYVGDDRRDIEAGHAAGMGTVAAAYGYCADTDPRDWSADALINSPIELLELLP